MRSLVLLLLIILISQSNWGQIEFGSNPYDIGIVTANGADFVDIPVRNNGKEKVYIFRTDADKRFQIHYSSKTILPDSTVYIRILFTPEKKGFINEKVLVHFSHLEEPVSLKLHGYCEELPLSNNIDCPSFNQQNISTSLENPFTVKVIDNHTGEPIQHAEVLFIQNGVKIQTVETNKKGLHTQKLSLGYYYIIANHPSYLSNEQGMYVNRKNNHITIPLDKIEDYPPLEEEFKEETIATDTTHRPAEIDIPIVRTDSIIVPPINEEPYLDLPISEYKPNNIVFLLDVSSSMNFAGKIDLLKASMIELTKVLRPIDKITIVAYSSSAEVILETTSIDNSDTIISLIQSLKPKGMTAGGKGMSLAYEKAKEASITNGNNQIIMATDGVFNMGDENVNKLAKKYYKKGVTVSVIGIKNREAHEESMYQLSVDGGGNYINILNFEQAQNTLINEIKNQSRIKP